MKWGDGTNGIKWAGAVNETFAGDVKVPVVGKSELFTMSVSNLNITPFKITANEVYKINGGLRP